MFSRGMRSDTEVMASCARLVFLAVAVESDRSAKAWGGSISQAKTKSSFLVVIQGQA